MNDVLKRLYDSINEENTSRNPFMTDEAYDLYGRFMCRYFGSEDSPKRDEACNMLCDLFDLIQKKTFETGFYVCTDMLMR